MSDTNPTQPPSDISTTTPPVVSPEPPKDPIDTPATTPPVVSPEPPKDPVVNKKCIVCGYEGPEPVCPKEQMLMEEKCPKCNRCKSDCICEINKTE